MPLDLKDFIFHKIKLKEAEEKQKLWKLRISSAKDGIRAYAKKDVQGAIKAYNAYFDALRIGLKLEHNTEIKAAQFNKEKDGAEMLLIAFISFDMMKIYDKMKGPNFEGEFQLARKRFADFTKGMKYQPLIAEMLRKYNRDQLGKTAHKKEFENTYTEIRIKLGKCFIAHAVFTEDEPEIEILRKFRDDVLARFFLGRKFISLYYKLSPGPAIFLDPKIGPLSPLGKFLYPVFRRVLSAFTKVLKF